MWLKTFLLSLDWLELNLFNLKHVKSGSKFNLQSLDEALDHSTNYICKKVILSEETIH